MNPKPSILANDGIDESARSLLEAKGYELHCNKIQAGELAGFIQKHQISVLIVRSATQVRKELIEACPSLKIIARAGVGTDNIDVDFAGSKGISVINTPSASSRSVAELVMAHLLGVYRFLHQSHREMPSLGHQQFNELKKKYAQGREVLGKSIGIIGFGRIGQQVASMALGLGMKVLAYDPYVKEALIEIPVPGITPFPALTISTVSLEKVLRESDAITLHVPGSKIIGEKELALMKKNVVLINTSRGEVIDGKALQQALDSRHVLHACLDVFENEPHPDPNLLQHPFVSSSPHIGASTMEAQERIGKELAEKIIDLLEKNHA